ncbi:hypothetical protein L7F22_016625 [Adiantum nelumboides]|nr:hypothetical protein [Adiantum nelumboides]
MFLDFGLPLFVSPHQQPTPIWVRLPKQNYYETLENDWGVFFWRPPGFLSNWTSSPFRYAGEAYYNAEQAIMHRKALLFGDYTVAKKIMSTTDPRQALGRQVRGFDTKTWEQTIPGLLFAILHAKFSQNQAFGCALIETGHK